MDMDMFYTLGMAIIDAKVEGIKDEIPSTYNYSRNNRFDELVATVNALATIKNNNR